MKPASGPLKTGAYMAHAALNPGQYHTIHKENGGGHLGLTEDKAHEGIKWHLESLGDYKYRARNHKWNLTPVPPTGPNTAIELGEGESEWIIKPTDVDGEYTASPVADPAKYVCATQGEATIKVCTGTDVTSTKFRIYHADDE